MILKSENEHKMPIPKPANVCMPTCKDQQFLSNDSKNNFPSSLFSAASAALSG